MKEFCGGTNWKWGFYEWNGKPALLKSGREFYFEIVPSVFYKIKFFEGEGNLPKKLTFIDEDLYKILMDKFFCPLRELDKSDMINIALEVLNKRPHLRYSTCLGWTPYEDKTKNPNYFGGTYIFPDGNEYTITFHRGVLSVFPGDVDAYAAISLRLPLISKKVNLQQWADRIYKDENIIIEFEEKEE